MKFRRSPGKPVLRSVSRCGSSDPIVIPRKEPMNKDEVISLEGNMLPFVTLAAKDWILYHENEISARQCVKDDLFEHGNELVARTLRSLGFSSSRLAKLQATL